jgi:hypothetical protein
MDVNDIQNSPELQRIPQRGSQGPHKGAEGGMRRGPGRIKDAFQKSELGSIFQQASKMSEEDSAAVHEFGKSIADSIRDGSFDAASLAANAPDAVVQMAEEQGLSIEDAIAELGATIQQMGPPKGMRPPPPPPPPMGSLDILNSEDEDETENIVDIFSTEDDSE